jgi:hypothetical protein
MCNQGLQKGNGIGTSGAFGRLHLALGPPPLARHIIVVVLLIVRRFSALRRGRGNWRMRLWSELEVVRLRKHR